jgi:DNA mismatch endonuclease (patch repair protein)
MDIMSKKERSKRMSLIRSKWTKQERWLHGVLKGYKIRHVMHPKMTGSPDVILKDKKIAIFLHGCFWHGCKKCYKAPSSNNEFWAEKLRKNLLKDTRDIRNLQQAGWKIIVMREHEISRSRPLASCTALLNKYNLVQKD